MNIEYIKQHYTFETLNASHNLDDFECESDDLTDFLKYDALKQQNMNLNITQLVICDDIIIGYVSLLTDVMKLKIIEDKTAKLKIQKELNISENNELPAVKIGRFAIDKKYANQGLGSHVLGNVLLSILKLSKNKIGFRFVTVEAYAIALDFYMKNNFLIRKSDTKKLKKLDRIKRLYPETCFNIYLDLKDI